MPSSAPAPGENEIFAVAVFNIFGSEEMSSLSRGFARLIPEPYILIHPDDARARRIENGNLVELEIKGRKRVFSARIVSDILPGHAGVSSGLPGFEWLDLPNRGKIRTVSR